jgi:hypothetical protein
MERMRRELEKQRRGIRGERAAMPMEEHAPPGGEVGE